MVFGSVLMEEKMARGIINLSVIKDDNVHVQVTTFKPTKKNYIHWAAVIKMRIAGRDRIDYINGR